MRETVAEWLCDSQYKDCGHAMSSLMPWKDEDDLGRKIWLIQAGKLLALLGYSEAVGWLVIYSDGAEALYRGAKPTFETRKKVKVSALYLRAKPPTLHERDSDGNWICCCGDSLEALVEQGEAVEPLTLLWDEECPGCAKGEAPIMLDEDGVLAELSGKPGRLGHAHDDWWWYCCQYLAPQRERLREPDGYNLTGPLYDDNDQGAGLFETEDEARTMLQVDLKEWNSDLDGDEPEEEADHRIEPVWIGSPILTPSTDPEPEEWWCFRCEKRVPGTEVTFEETHDQCGGPAGHQPAQREPGERDSERGVAYRFVGWRYRRRDRPKHWFYRPKNEPPSWAEDAEKVFAVAPWPPDAPAQREPGENNE